MYAKNQSEIMPESCFYAHVLIEMFEPYSWAGKMSRSGLARHRKLNICSLSNVQVSNINFVCYLFVPGLPRTRIYLCSTMPQPGNMWLCQIMSNNSKWCQSPCFYGHVLIVTLCPYSWASKLSRSGLARHRKLHICSLSKDQVPELNFARFLFVPGLPRPPFYLYFRMPQPGYMFLWKIM